MTSSNSPWLHASSALPVFLAVLAHKANLQTWPFMANLDAGQAAASQSAAAAAAGLREVPHPVGNTGITSIIDCPGVVK